MFEGLGLGARLAILPLPKKYNWVAYAGATAYSVVTPLGVAIGLAVRTKFVHSSSLHRHLRLLSHSTIDR